jgi:hypothetical protein
MLQPRTHPPPPVPHSPLPWTVPYLGKLELRDATGRPVMLALVERDACSRKQAEADLEFVRRAVNGYEELRSIVEDLARCYGASDLGGLFDAMDRAKRAVAGG